MLKYKKGGTLVCKNCQKTFTTDHKKPYCSNACKQSAWKNRYSHQCEQCGIEFNHQLKKTRFCGQSCSSLHAQLKKFPNCLAMHTCKECGTLFKPKSQEYSTFCGRACAARFGGRELSQITQQRNKETSILNAPADGYLRWLLSWRLCEYCGCEFTTHVYKKYCSGTCVYEAKMAADSYKEYLNKQRLNNLNRPMATLSCKSCGLDFKTNMMVGRRKYCFTCTHMQSHTCNHYQRAKFYGVAYEYVINTDVFERDNWTCKICDQPINKNIKYPDPFSASIDHRIPLSKGGPHSYNNCQASHLTCNVRKCNNVDN